MSEDIVAVELIRYDNPRQKQFDTWIVDHSSQLKPYDNDKSVVVEGLQEGAEKEFIEALGSQLILYKYYGCDSPNGFCVKVTYSSGNFLIVNQEYIGEYESNGSVVDIYGVFENGRMLDDIVNEYFSYHTDAHSGMAFGSGLPL